MIKDKALRDAFRFDIKSFYIWLLSGRHLYINLFGYKEFYKFCKVKSKEEFYNSYHGVK